jgi:copper(I)-binding protein
VNLASDGTYIELVDLAGPLELNRGFEITLEFANSPSQKVDVDVRDASTAN